MEEDILTEPYLKEMTASCVSVFTVSDEVRPLPLNIFEIHDCTQEEINDVCERLRKVATSIKRRGEINTIGVIVHIPWDANTNEYVNIPPKYEE